MTKESLKGPHSLGNGAALGPGAVGAHEARQVVRDGRLRTLDSGAMCACWSRARAVRWTTGQTMRSVEEWAPAAMPGRRARRLLKSVTEHQVARLVREIGR
ncbi:hypothetical protein [Streptomyces sp. 061-3]|uniref:hypothetical protein n=1 Tax=Streptomyces sp. 061-3 TaxID=2789268 RepID=UPI00397F5F10